jgi:hypothetical protein
VSTSDKPDTARGWQFVQKLLADEDVERLDDATDEEVERQMKAQGVRAARVPDVEKLVANVATRRDKYRDNAAKKAVAVVRPPSRTRWIAWLAAAAIGAAVVVLVAKRQEVIALFHREPAPPRPLQKPEDIILVRQERANALRREAFAACDQASWTLCEVRLDEARSLDPKGEEDPRVQEARKQIYRARHPGDAGQRLLPDTK